ncbi:MAG: ATP-dependent DNA ligase [Candidatus Diapherotrites archaeon]|nr:ATP-dependent DNA ligase [Candidatus Diapherotrites archaeon]
MQFRKLSEYFERLEATPSRLEMTDLLSGLFKEANANEIEKIIYLCQGQLAPAYMQIDVGMGEKFVMEALSKVSGYTREEIEKLFKELGDLGLVAEKVSGKKRQSALFSAELTVLKVYENLMKISKASGTGSQEAKIKLLAELLNSAKPVEAKYLVRIPLQNLRLGVGDPTIMDAFAINFIGELRKNKKIMQEIEKELKETKEEKRNEEIERRLKFRLREMIEDKYNVRPDLGNVAKLLKQKGLDGLREIDIEPGIPIRPSLAERLPSSEEIIRKIGKCACEAKYDGFRIAVHKKGNEILLFSRRQENMTSMFPEIIEAARRQINAKDAILEGEALAVNEQTGEYFPFQITMQRKRKYDIAEKAEEYPLKLFVFDLLYRDGKNLMNLPFSERRRELDKIIKKGDAIELTKSIITDSPKEMEKFFEDSISKGLEGIIAKDLNAKYIAGARKFAWIKLKRSYRGALEDSVDVVILGYYKGKGLRTEFGLGALLSGVYDEKEDKFRTLAKVGSGFTEEGMVEMKKMLDKIKRGNKPARVDSLLEPDVWVEPKYVIEARADEITKSPMHTAGRNEKDTDGYALRFPRMIKLRTDRKAEEATTVKEIIDMYKLQKRVKTEDVGTDAA